MKILVVYGTSEGQTRKIAKFMEGLLLERNHQVLTADATDDPPAPDLYDLVIIGSSIHGHQYQDSIKHYVTKHLDQLNLKKSAFYSVCLAVASDIEEEHLEAQSIMDDFLTTTEWRPDHTTQMAGALRYTQYNYLKRFIMRMIAKKEGADTDVSKDHEYTDWKAVKDFTIGLVGNI